MRAVEGKQAACAHLQPADLHQNAVLDEGVLAEHVAQRSHSFGIATVCMPIESVSSRGLTYFAASNKTHPSSGVTAVNEFSGKSRGGGVELKLAAPTGGGCTAARGCTTQRRRMQRGKVVVCTAGCTACLIERARGCERASAARCKTVILLDRTQEAPLCVSHLHYRHCCVDGEGRAPGVTSP